MAEVDFSKVYSATYSNVPVYEYKVEGDSIMRRRSDDWINATHILKAAGFDKPARTRILEREVQKGVHEKVQGGYGKYQGTWIPLIEGRLLAERNNILEKLRPILDFVAGDRTPPPAPKHSLASKPRVPKSTLNTRRIANEDAFTAVKQQRTMGPPSLPYEQYEMSTALDEDDSIEQTTLESSSMMADEDMMPMSQHGGGGGYARKRKRGMNDVAAMSISEQEHILYGDQLLDYFMTVGDAPEATRVPPPEPPANFQVDRPIDDSGNTALHWACAMGDLEIVRDLLQRGANIKALSVHEETPLVRAVLFTNNYEKRTFPILLDLLLDTVSFRDWFGATIFHHVAETTRSKGKWKSSRYYCEILLEKLRQTFSQDELDLLLSCQDENGDVAALVAARNGAFRLVNLLLAYCPRAADLLNVKGETASGITRLHNPERDVPPAPSSVTMGNDHVDGEATTTAAAAAGTTTGPMNTDSQSGAPAQESSAVTSDLLSKIGVIMSEANKKLSMSYGSNTSTTNNGNSNGNSNKSNQTDLDDVANPETLYEQLELDRQKIRKQTAALAAKETEQGAMMDMQLGRYEQLKQNYESLLEQVQHSRLRERAAAAGVSEHQGPKPSTAVSDHNELMTVYHLSRQICTAQKVRRTALRELAQQTADAGVSTKFDVHRKLVALATGLKEEELDPMAAELAETLEFDRMNGKGSNAQSPEPQQPQQQQQQHRQGSNKEPTSLSFPGPTVSVDA